MPESGAGAAGSPLVGAGPGTKALGVGCAAALVLVDAELAFVDIALVSTGRRLAAFVLVSAEAAGVAAGEVAVTASGVAEGVAAGTGLS